MALRTITRQQRRDIFTPAKDPTEQAAPQEQIVEKKTWEYKGMRVVYRYTSPWDRRWELLIFDATKVESIEKETDGSPVYAWMVRKRHYHIPAQKLIASRFWSGWDIFILEDLIQTAKRKLAACYSPQCGLNRGRRTSHRYGQLGVSNWRMQLGQLNKILDEAQFDGKQLPIMSDAWSDPNLDIDLETTRKIYERPKKWKPKEK